MDIGLCWRLTQPQRTPNRATEQGCQRSRGEIIEISPQFDWISAKLGGLAVRRARGGFVTARLRREHRELAEQCGLPRKPARVQAPRRLDDHQVPRARVQGLLRRRWWLLPGEVGVQDHWGMCAKLSPGRSCCCCFLLLPQRGARYRVYILSFHVARSIRHQDFCQGVCLVIVC